MTWIKLEDEVSDHPKIAGLSDRAFRWWIRSLCYASRFLTDGVIPAVFLFGVKPNIRKELIDAKLWVERESRLEIHDYLEHQTSRAQVEAERERNRNRRNPGGRTSGTTAGSTSGTACGRTDENPRPEAEAEVPVPKTQIQKEQLQRGPAVVLSPAEYARRQQHCAFVGSRVQIPNGLHAELRDGHGGANPETELQAWYLTLNESAEVEQWRVPKDNQIYKWVKDHYAKRFPPTPVTKTPSQVIEQLPDWQRRSITAGRKL